MKDEIQILMSDKSNTTVVMNKSEYLDKMNEILSDKNRFQVTKTTSLITLQRKITKYLGQLVTLEIIDKNAYNYMKPYTPTPSKIYALVKAHKIDMPLRIIVSSVGSPINGLSRFFSKILRGIIDNDNRLINTYDLISKTPKMELKPEEILVSFDVVDMFGSIEVELVLDILNKRWNDIQMYTHLEKNIFMEGLILCLKENYLMYDGIIYNQIKGLPMGAILSPLIANIVMDDIFYRIIKPLELPFYYLYVDDSISAVKPDNIPKILELLNNYSNNIKFTVEIEKNGELPFLDTLIIRSGSNIITNIYKKPSKSNRMMNFDSYHPLPQKLSILYGEIARIYRISHISFLHENIENFIKQCELNGYTKKMVEQMNNKYIVKQWKMKKKIKTPENNLKFRGSLTYVPGLTDIMVKLFRSEGVLLAKRPVKPLSRLYKDMMVRDVLSESSVVYKINCKDCESFYIGQTGRLLRSRVIEHDKSVINKKIISALTIHALDNDHGFDFENVEILCRENDDFKRKMKESLHILKNREEVVNFKVDTENNVRYYSGLIDKLIK